jgi:hypothetical protein
MKKSGIYIGESAIKRIYKSWKLKDLYLELQATALERYGAPITYAITPPGVTPELMLDITTGKMRNKTIREATEEALENLRYSNALVFQNPTRDDVFEVGTLTTGNNFGDSFKDAITNCNKAIFTGLMIPKLLLEEGSGGLSNPGKVHWETFRLMIQAFAKEIVEPFTEQVIGRLIKLNFNDTRPGKFIIEAFDASTAEIIASVLKDFVSTGIIDPSNENDLDDIRERFGLPTRDRAPTLTTKEHQAILRAPADKIINDKLKAQAAMARSKAAEEKNKVDDDTKHRGLDIQERQTDEKMKLDRQKLKQDVQLKLETARMQHEQQMAMIKKGLIAQPTAVAPKGPTTPTAKKPPSSGGSK